MRRTPLHSLFLGVQGAACCVLRPAFLLSAFFIFYQYVLLLFFSNFFQKYLVFGLSDLPHHYGIGSRKAPGKVATYQSH